MVLWFQQEYLSSIGNVNKKYASPLSKGRTPCQNLSLLEMKKNCHYVINIFLSVGILFFVRPVHNLNFNGTSLHKEQCLGGLHLNRLESEFTIEDAVRGQYNHLSYPMVTHEEINDEQQLYNSNRINDTIAVISNDNDLEVLNHFLYQGKQNFK